MSSPPMSTTPTTPQSVPIEDANFFMKKINNTRIYPNEYLYNLYGNISWPLDDVFKNKTAELINSKIDGIGSSQVATLTTKGHTSTAPDDTTGYGIWFSPNNGISEHTFNNIYKKIACCTNQQDITIPYIKARKDGKPIYDDFKVNIQPNENRCYINGIQYFDKNNSLQPTPNQNCSALMQKTMAFLKIYDPKNPLIERVGGCIDDSLLPPNPTLANIVISNRTCGPFAKNCKLTTAWKGSNERKNCSLTFCDQRIDIKDVQALKGAVNFNDIVQECSGGNLADSFMGGITGGTTGINPGTTGINPGTTGNNPGTTGQKTVSGKSSTSPKKLSSDDKDLSSTKKLSSDDKDLSSTISTIINSFFSDPFNLKGNSNLIIWILIVLCIFSILSSSAATLVLV